MRWATWLTLAHDRTPPLSSDTRLIAGDIRTNNHGNAISGAERCGPARTRATHHAPTTMAETCSSVHHTALGTHIRLISQPFGTHGMGRCGFEQALTCEVARAMSLGGIATFIQNAVAQPEGQRQKTAPGAQPTHLSPAAVHRGKAAKPGNRLPRPRAVSVTV
jgi:hypothetical protein